MDQRQDQLNIKLRQIRRRKYQLNAQQKQTFNKLFQNSISVNFRDRNIAKLVIKGVPSTYRIKIWPQLIKNNHGITWNYYRMLCQRVNSIKKHPENENNRNLLQKFAQIQIDIQRTFPQLKVFQKGNQLYQLLFNILSAWTVYRQDIGYIQGMSNIAALLLIQLKQAQVLPIFASLMTSDVLHACFTFNIGQINRMQQKFEYYLRIKQETLYYHLKERKVDTKIYLFSWLINLFTRCLQFQVLGRIWDLLLLHELSEDFIIEVAFKILNSQKKRILNCSQPEQILKILKKAKIDQLGQEQFIKQLQQFSLCFPFQANQ